MVHIGWENIVSIFQKQIGNNKTRASSINPQEIQENMYMQYLLGYTCFSGEEPFDASLFVDIRKRLRIGQINAINV